MTPQPGVNLIGHVSTNLGLGVAARNTAQLLADGPWKFTVVDVRTATMRAHQERAWEGSYWRGSGPAPYSVNLFHFNPPEIAAELRLRPRWLDTGSRLNVCVPFWELPRLPESWIPTMAGMDVILAPTRYVGEAVRASVPDAEIVVFPQTVYVPEGVRSDRRAWGFGDDDVVFVCSFDLNSDPARKNPRAAIEAFRLAEPDLPTGARLVIKANNPQTRMGRFHMDELSAAIAGDPSIEVLTRQLSYPDVLSLYASADAYISLHRAEGLGLGLLESMMLGTPVIATAYSGNLDFMTEDDSMLVGYDLLPVEGSGQGSYAAHKIGEGQTWAEARVGEARDRIVEMASSADVRRGLAERARAAALATQTNPQRSAAIDTVIARSLDAGSLKNGLPINSASSAVYWRARRFVGGRLRDAGLR